MAELLTSGPWDGDDPVPTAEERALGAELARLDALERDAWESIADAEGWPIEIHADEMLDSGGSAYDEVHLDDASLLASLSPVAHESQLGLLASIDPAALPHELDVVAYVQALDRVAAFVAALQHEALVTLGGRTPSSAYLDEVHVEQEIAIARTTSRYSAGRALATARRLADLFPAFLAALRTGEVSQAHCTVLVDRTEAVADRATLRRIESLALPKARRLAPGAFGREVATMVSRYDADAAARCARAREKRRAWTRRLDDGMGCLGLVHDWSTVQAMRAAITADALGLRAAPGRAPTAATSDSGWDDESLDACRADALAARVLGTVADDGSVSWDRSDARAEVSLVIDLDTLRREQEHPCLLDGEPVPAALGRELAAGARAWRRMVTDPVTGHLLDYGRTTYLPDALRTFVLARDGGCHAPGCTTRAASRMQMDHVVPYPDGPSDAANAHGWCTTCHQLKTAGYAEVLDARADGSATWITAWGQRLDLPPRRFLPGSEPDPPPAPPPAAEHDPPPF